MKKRKHLDKRNDLNKKLTLKIGKMPSQVFKTPRLNLNGIIFYYEPKDWVSLELI